MSGSAHKSKARAQQGASRQRRTDKRQQRPFNQVVPETPAALTRLQQQAGNRVSSGLLGAGRPLPPSIRTEMETRFATDFGDVRVHDDALARGRADTLGANAFAHGSHLVFGNQGLDTTSPGGRRLLAHELAHVVQQRRGGAAPALDPTAPHEQAADAAAGAVVSNTPGPVAVAGATGVGLAADWKDWVKSKAAEYVPDEVKEVAADIEDTVDDYKGQAEDWVDEQVDEYVPQEVQDAAGKASDMYNSLSDTAGGFLNPTSLLDDTITELRDAALNDLIESATGEDLDAPGLREVAHENSQEAIGVAKGAAVQVTETVDTLVWVGSELRDLKEDAIRTTARAVGVDEEKAVEASRTASAFGFGGGLDSLAQLGDLMEDVGLVDERGKPSLTKPVAEGYNALADKAEEVIGAPKSDDDSFFTPMEIGELKGAIGTQLALATVGATEVKVAMNVAGALSSLRAIVESARHDPNWRTSPQFWGGIIGMVLSIVGLKHVRAASKITTMVLKYGWVVAAVPPMAAMIDTYLDTSLSEEERERRMKQHWMQVVHVLKDAVLHITQAVQSGKPPPRPSSASQAKGLPAKSSAAPPPKQQTKTPSKALSASPKTPAPDTTAASVVKRNPTVSNGPVAATTNTSKPTNAQPLESNAVPFARRPGLPQSAQSKRNTQNLKNLPPEKQGTVTPLRRPNKNTPPSEAARQDVPLEMSESPKIVVGQTHAPVESTPRPLRAVDSNPQTVAAARGSGSKTGTSRPKAGGTNTRSRAATNRRSNAGAGTGTKARPSRARPAKAGTKGKAKQSGVGKKPPLTPVNANGGRGGNAEPLVAVRVGGGGAKRKGTFYEEGTPQYDRVADNNNFSVMPKSQAEALGFRPSGTPYDTSIQPMKIGGKQVESGGAGGGKGNKHNITGRAGLKADPKAANDTFLKTIGASRDEAHGYKQLLQDGELGVVRPGNVSTGGVDAITVSIEGGKAKIMLNDFTSPSTSKGAKATHAKWAGELDKALADKSFGFGDRKIGNRKVDDLVQQARDDKEVYVRPVRIKHADGKVEVKAGTPRKVPVKARPKRMGK